MIENVVQYSSPPSEHTASLYAPNTSQASGNSPQNAARPSLKRLAPEGAEDGLNGVSSTTGDLPRRPGGEGDPRGQLSTAGDPTRILGGEVDPSREPVTEECLAPSSELGNIYHKCVCD